LNSRPPERRGSCRRPRRALAALLFVFSATAGADRAADLEQLRQRLGRLQAELEESRGERDEARDRLRDTERRIGTLVRNLRDTETRSRQQSARLQSLEAVRVRTRRERDQHYDDLEQAVRAAHARGRQESLKLLLSQEDPARASRMLAYYRYLAEARVTRIDRLTAALSRLQAVEREIGERQRELLALRQQQLEQKHSLDGVRAERSVALARLNEQVRSRSQEIERLRRDEERLARLVRGLRAALPPPAPAARPGPAPVVGRGQWRLPVQGRVAARYGQIKAPGELRWRGLFLATAEGQPVRAVSGGRVAYADWLRGFGLLLVLDHGQGLMTLYGHNQSLVKAVGDPIESGETIALSGNTGGPPQPGLYFEVRQHGEPRDPLDWCKL
jgi:septal ring factor EnvC (AmiA/AmiB activator)